MRRNIPALCMFAPMLAASAAFSDDGSRPISLDHYVRVKSITPAIRPMLRSPTTKWPTCATRRTATSAAPSRAPMRHCLAATSRMQISKAS